MCEVGTVPNWSNCPEVPSLDMGIPSYVMADASKSACHLSMGPNLFI